MKFRLQFRLRSLLVLTALIGWGMVALPFWWPICAGWCKSIYYYRENKIREARDKEFWSENPYLPSAKERTEINALSAEIERTRRGLPPKE
ncbi:MAG TPA: hypothetical protein VMV10_20750 [Pirellulales bacterium]|nr:hypothetical protein [Pirellulales bacterium]